MKPDVHRRRDAHESFAVHSPKLINTRSETLAHHLPAHTPLWIGRHTGEAHCPPAPPAIDGIQNAHYFLGRFRLRDRKEIFGVFAFLAKVDQEHLGFAVYEAWPKDSIHRRRSRSLYHLAKARHVGTA